MQRGAWCVLTDAAQAAPEFGATEGRDVVAFFITPFVTEATELFAALPVDTSDNAGRMIDRTLWAH